MGIFSFTEKKKDFIVRIIPEVDPERYTDVGITGYRSEVKKLVDDWLCDSTLDSYDRDKIVGKATGDEFNISCSYGMILFERNAAKPDIELDEEGYLIK